MQSKKGSFIKFFLVLTILLASASAYYFLFSTAPRFEGKVNASFSPNFRCKALYKLNNEALALTNIYYRINPDTLSCKTFDAVTDSIQTLCTTPDGKHIFALALESEIPYFFDIVEGKQKLIALPDSAKYNTEILYSVLVCDNERVVLINPKWMYTWKIKEIHDKPAFEFENHNATGCEYSCFAMRDNMLYVGEDREHYGGKLICVNLDNGKFETLIEKSVVDLLFDQNGTLWTINKLPNGDPGKICTLDPINNQLKVITSITRPNPDRNEAKVLLNWDYPVTQFQKLFLNEQNELMVATDSQGFFQFDKQKSKWNRVGPDKIFGLEAFEKILLLNNDKVLVAGHINNECTFMIFDFKKNSYKLLAGDPNQVKER